VKLTKILLRWYKSFHLNYRGISEKGETTAYPIRGRLSPPYASGEEFPFIEIPIEDITTIVGANESGKSHLLNAITKVIRGTGSMAWTSSNAPICSIMPACEHAMLRHGQISVCSLVLT
jgi:hypothetical protein